MHLLNVITFRLETFRGPPPPYAIASHRWLKEEDEPTFNDARNRNNGRKPGWTKVRGFIKHVQTYYPDIERLWIDTCCINKSDDVEHKSALNSMFDWYKNAAVCLAYLADVVYFEDKKLSRLEKPFHRSEWFRRRWTLQELLAPKVVVFLTSDWQIYGSKGDGSDGQHRRLESIISRVTRIPIEILEDADTLDSVTPMEIIAWAEGRETSRKEDMWYCLCGLLGAWIDANYGEGDTGARARVLGRLEVLGHIKKGDGAKIAQELDKAARKRARERPVQMFEDSASSSDDMSDEESEDEEEESDRPVTREVSHDLVVRLCEALIQKGYTAQDARVIAARFRSTGRISLTSQMPDDTASIGPPAAPSTIHQPGPRVQLVSQRSDQSVSRRTTTSVGEDSTRRDLTEDERAPPAVPMSQRPGRTELSITTSSTSENARQRERLQRQAIPARDIQARAVSTVSQRRDQAGLGRSTMSIGEEAQRRDLLRRHATPAVNDRAPRVLPTSQMSSDNVSEQATSASSDEARRRDLLRQRLANLNLRQP